MSEGIEAGLTDVLGLLLPHLDERQRRLVLGAAARVLGHGGIRSVAGAAGVAESTVSRGLRELKCGDEPAGRVRSVGAGRETVLITRADARHRTVFPGEAAPPPSTRFLHGGDADIDAQRGGAAWPHVLAAVRGY